MDIAITLLVVFVVLPIFFAFIVNIPKVLRSWRLRKVADEFGLSFDKGFNNMKFYFWSVPADKNYDDNSRDFKRNIIEGNLNNHLVKLYDFYEYHYLYSSARGGNVSYYSRYAVFIHDGQEKKLRGSLFVTGFPSVSKIRKALVGIKNSL